MQKSSLCQDYLPRDKGVWQQYCCAYFIPHILNSDYNCSSNSVTRVAAPIWYEYRKQGTTMLCDYLCMCACMFAESVVKLVSDLTQP